MRASKWQWTRVMILPLICCLSSIVSCQSVPVHNTKEVKASVKGCSRAFVKEHSDLFAENLRLKQALEICQAK